MITVNSDIFTWEKSAKSNRFFAIIRNSDMPDFEGNFFNVRSSRTNKILTFSVDTQEMIDNEGFDGEMVPFHSQDGDRKLTITLVNDF